MPRLSFENHFRFGYNQEAFNNRKMATDKWWVEYGRCARSPLNFREECIATARVVSEDAVGPIWVLFSGGVDSEVALRSFVEAKIPVQAAIARFKDDLNLHDIAYAVIACESLGVPYRFFDLDLLRFWNSEGLDYADRTRCVTPQLLSTMWLVDQVDGYAILGSGECYLVKNIPSDYQPGVSPYSDTTWSLWEKEKIASWYRHFMVSNRDGCPGFFQFTPEIMLSYLLDPQVIDLVRNRCPGKLSTSSSKLPIYKKYFSLIDRPKYTGFERVMEQDKVLRAYLEKKYADSNEVCLTEYDLLVASLSPYATQNQPRPA